MSALRYGTEGFAVLSLSKDRPDISTPHFTRLEFVVLSLSKEKPDISTPHVIRLEVKPPMD